MYTFHSDVLKVNSQQKKVSQCGCVPVFGFYNNRDRQLETQHDNSGIIGINVSLITVEAKWVAQVFVFSETAPSYSRLLVV